MQLVDPTDYRILAFLAAGGRNNAINIAAALELDRSYVNTRLRALAEADLLERVGPAPNSGLYQLTDVGRGALAEWAGREPAAVEELAFEDLIAAGGD